MQQQKNMGGHQNKMSLTFPQGSFLSKAPLTILKEKKKKKKKVQANSFWKQLNPINK
jgi:hypothetical protein